MLSAEDLAEFDKSRGPAEPVPANETDKQLKQREDRELERCLRAEDGR